LPLNPVFNGLLRLRRVTLALALLGAACVGSENIETSYRSLSEARSKGIVGERKWIPEIVPEAATDLVMVRNADTSAAWACFRPNGQSEQVVRLIGTLNGRPTKGPVSEAPRAWFSAREWWPDSMSQEGGEVYEFTESSGATIRVGIDRSNNCVCFRRHR
jgi:hypothetical protein